MDSSDWTHTRMFTSSSDYGLINDYTYPGYELEGTTVCRYSINDVTRKSGKLNSVYVTIPMIQPDGEEYIKTDLFECNIGCAGGDSGEPIGTLSRSGTPYYLSIMGITTGGDSTTTYGTKITNIFSALSVTLA